MKAERKAGGKGGMEAENGVRQGDRELGKVTCRVRMTRGQRMTGRMEG